MNPEMELLKRLTIADIVTNWGIIKDKIEQGCRALREADELLTITFGHDTFTRRLSMTPLRLDSPEEIIASVRHEAWRAMVERMEVRRVLSVKRAREIDQALKDGHMIDGSPLPEITAERILEMVQSFSMNLNDFLAQAVKEVFDFLRPGGWYVTNVMGKCEIADRVILQYMIDRRYGGGFRVRFSREAEVRALDNVFHLLDGAGTTKSHYGELFDAISQSPTGAGETTYFEFKCYKNGNLHLKFKRPDLVKKLNAIAGGANLKPSGSP